MVLDRSGMLELLRIDAAPKLVRTALLLTQGRYLDMPSYYPHELERRLVAQSTMRTQLESS